MDTPSFTENLKNAEQFKLSGNDAFKSMEYRKAIGCYHRALLYLKAITAKKSPFSELMSQNSTSRVPDDVLKKTEILTSDCYNNLAASLLAVEDPKNEKVIEYCKKSLAINPDNLKAVFRMGTALANLGQYEKAKDVLTSHKAYGREKKIVQLLAHVEKKIKEGDEDSKKLYQRMFQSKSTRPLSHTEQIKEHFPQDSQKIPKVDLQVMEEEGCSAEQNRGHTTEKNGGEIDKDSSLVSECFKVQPDNISDLESKAESL